MENELEPMNDFDVNVRIRSNSFTGADLDAFIKMYDRALERIERLEITLYDLLRPTLEQTYFEYGDIVEMRNKINEALALDNE